MRWTEDEYQEYIQKRQGGKVYKPKNNIITVYGELPDLNTIIDQSKSHWANYSKMKKTYTSRVAQAAIGAKRVKKADIDITYYCKNRRKDPDNIIGGGNKFVLDGLVKAGVIENDGWRHVNSLNCRCRLDKDNPRVEIRIRETG